VTERVDACSIALPEVFLRDRAKSYNEPFTIKITKFDGTTAVISNQDS
jgi:hypothetical protein